MRLYTPIHGHLIPLDLVESENWKEKAQNITLLIHPWSICILDMVIMHGTFNILEMRLMNLVPVGFLRSMRLS